MSIPDNIKIKWYEELLKMHWSIKLLVLALILFSLIIGARMGFWGEAVQSSTAKIIPINRLDCDEDRLISLHLSFETNGKFGKLDGKYKSGDTVKLIANLDSDNYITIVGIDKNKVYPIINNSLDPFFYTGTDSITEEFQLDKTTGKEVFYAIASNCKFFYKDIEDKIEFIRKGIKGKESSEYNLDISQYHEFIYFNHIEK